MSEVDIDERSYKRDGTIVEFDRDRIVRAMTMAFKQSSGTVNNELVEK